MKWGRFVSFPILAVLMLMVFVYYVTMFIFLDDWVGLQSSAGWLNGLIFSLLAFLSLISLFFSVLTDPGGVPSGYVPDVEDSDGSDQERKKTGVHLRRCEKCSAFKPPRAHHCRACRRCVLKMDHHCTWINNCVGHKNYKAFVLLVVYSTIASIHSLITMAAMVLLLSLTLGTLLGWHVYLMTHNMTTIEYYEGTRASWLAKKSGQSYHHPFDVGVYRNLTLILGPSMVKWLCPTAMDHVKDGVDFPTVKDSL